MEGYVVTSSQVEHNGLNRTKRRMKWRPCGSIAVEAPTIIAWEWLRAIFRFSYKWRAVK